MHKVVFEYPQSTTSARRPSASPPTSPTARDMASGAPSTAQQSSPLLRQSRHSWEIHDRDVAMMLTLKPSALLSARDGSVSQKSNSIGLLRPAQSSASSSAMIVRRSCSVPGGTFRLRSSQAFIGSAQIASCPTKSPQSSAARISGYDVIGWSKASPSSPVQDTGR